MKDAAVGSAPAEMSPAGKKLVQARLPFKVVSPVAPKPPPAARKRKLSAQPSESASKLSKENELVEELVLISDDDSDATRPPNVGDVGFVDNPYLKIVDKAIRKKLQKKTPRKRKHGKSEVHLKNKSSDCKVAKKIDQDIETDTSSNKQKATSDDDDVVVVDDKSSDDLKGLENVGDEKKKSDQGVKVIKDDHEVMEVDENVLENDVSVSKCEDDKFQEKETTTTISSEENPAYSDATDKVENGNRQLAFACDEKDDDADIQIIENTERLFSTNKSSKSPSKSEESEKEDSVQSLISTDPNATPKRRSNRTKNTRETIVTSTDTTSVQPTEANNSSSEVNTPKQKTRKSLGDDDTHNKPSSPDGSALTPKQLQRKLESAKKKGEKEKERLERENKRLQEKEERNKIKLEKEELRRKEREEREEQKKKEREGKEEQKRKEKEEKERQKELEKKDREMKEELKRKEKEEKEEQRRKEKEAKEEERRKKLEALEEEKRQKEIEKVEQETKKKKAAAAFVNFFVPKQKADLNEAGTSAQSNHNMLSSFMVKSDMRLAPTVRNYIDCDQKISLESNLASQDLPKKALYLYNLRDKVVTPRTSEKTWPLDDKEDDCMIIESEEELPPAAGSGEVVMQSRERLRPKLLSFHENRRPPYWGTWRKKSDSVRARRPFGADKRLDYEVDSESEWEDEGEGESIAGSAAGSVDEERDEYEVDNDFFVPHGYLSDEEATMDEDDVLSLSPETQKLKLKHLEDEFEFEMKKPTEKLKPRLYGMLWENSAGGKPENCVDPLWNYFGRMTMILEDPTALLQPPPEPEKPEKKRKKTITKGDETPEASPKSAGKRKRAKPVKRDAPEAKKLATEALKNQPVINTFLTKINST